MNVDEFVDWLGSNIPDEVVRKHLQSLVASAETAATKAETERCETIVQDYPWDVLARLHWSAIGPRFANEIRRTAPGAG